MPFAPIALFAFRRPRHVGLALRSLMLNPELADSPIHIYCDGPRNAADREAVEAARKVVRELAPAHATIIERQANLGLDRSVVTGVSELCQRHGRVIVLEDDLEVAPDFLRYVNAALDKYADDERVMQVSGYQFPVEIVGENDAVFLPYTTSWGWATWERAWNHFDHSAPAYAALRSNSTLRREFDLDGSYPYFRMLKRNLDKPLSAWDIAFYSNVFARRGLALHPRVSRVRNNGFDGSGSTCGKFATAPVTLSDKPSEMLLPEQSTVDSAAYAAVKRHLRHESQMFVKLVRRIEARVSQ